MQPGAAVPTQGKLVDQGWEGGWERKEVGVLVHFLNPQQVIHLSQPRFLGPERSEKSKQFILLEMEV